jgi:drug/metabolite transporter (DMT)-like permease
MGSAAGSSPPRLVLFALVAFFHGGHGLCQEYLFSLPGFRFGSLLTVSEIAMYCVCASLEKMAQARGASLWSLGRSLLGSLESAWGASFRVGSDSRGSLSRVELLRQHSQSQAEEDNVRLELAQGTQLVRRGAPLRGAEAEFVGLEDGEGIEGRRSPDNVAALWDGRQKRAGPPLWSYAVVAGLLSLGQSAGNMSMNYGVSFPAKVTLKSGKAIPTLLLGVVVSNTEYNVTDYLVAITMSVGVVLFALADRAATTDPSSTSVSSVDSAASDQYLGVLLLMISVLLDSLMTNFQQKILGEWGGKRSDMIIVTNLLALVGAVAIALPDVPQLFASFRDSDVGALSVIFVLAVEGLCAYLGTSCLLTLLQEHGAVTSMLAANCRKVGSVIFSFLLFPKPFSSLYVLGGMLVFGSAIVHPYIKDQPIPAWLRLAPRSWTRMRKDAVFDV